MGKEQRKNQSERSKQETLETHPTEDVLSSILDRVMVIIDTCLVVSNLEDKKERNE